MEAREGESSVEQDFRGLEQMSCQVVSRAKTNCNDSLVLNSARDNFINTVVSVQHTNQALKDSIRELLNVQESVQTQLDDLRSQTLGPQATQLMSQISDAEDNKTELEKEIDSLVNSINYKEEQGMHLENKVTSSTKRTIMDFPKFMTGMEMISMLSNLRWDYSTSEDTVKGFILRTDKKDIIPFKFEKKTHSQFFITNFLWEQIASDGFL